VVFSRDGRVVAVAVREGFIRLWEVATGQMICELESPSAVYSLAFSPDGKTLASAGDGDFSILIWDVTGGSQDLHVAGRKLSPKKLASLWQDLAGNGAYQAHRAIWRLVGNSKQALPYLRDRLQSVLSVNPQRLTELISALDSDRFSDRDQAMRELEKLRELAEPALLRTLDGRPSAEVRRRVQSLLDKLAERSPEDLRFIRGVAVLEHIGKSEAYELLKVLARGAPEARLTQHALAAIERLTSLREACRSR
jgi:hypothetical protein